MKVFIPTMGRLNEQPTWGSLNGNGVCDVTLVCPLNELERHRDRGRNAISPPDSVTRIAPTRKWIMENAADDNYIVMMDDDLTFAVRRDDDPTRFRPAGKEDISDMLVRLAALFAKGASHVSIAMREGANRNTEEVLYNTRVARVIGYNREVFLNEGADFTNSTVMDDFEVTLHLLTRGHANVVLNSYVQNQKSSGSPGGASLYRDLAMHKAAAEKLASRYPKFVKTVVKTTKTAWGGATRTDVLVQWKKAYEYGVNNYGRTR